MNDRNRYAMAMIDREGNADLWEFSTESDEKAIIMAKAEYFRMHKIGAATDMAKLYVPILNLPVADWLDEIEKAKAAANSAKIEAVERAELARLKAKYER